MFAIVDIETTGGNSRSAKITEIAIYIHNGQQVVDEFCSLINPEVNIPFFITKLTGISNEMVENAPRFFEVARRIIEMTTGCVFVAHNVGFDYSFVKQEFKNLGYDFQRKTLCTVKLSRKFLPGHASYSLGRLCQDLAITINGRHRASGDALATVRLFEMLLERVDATQGFFINPEKPALTILHHAFDASSLEKLPEEAGVYYFFNERGEAIYVGKSKNIRNRVQTHFSGPSSRKTTEMIGSVARVDYDLTGSELLALLLESHQIKSLQPRYNRLQRRLAMSLGLFADMNDKGYILFEIASLKRAGTPLATFTSMEEARNFTMALADRYELCQKLCGVYDGAGACFFTSIGQCHGACAGLEEVQSYNLRAMECIKSLRFEEDNFFLIDRGRHPGEKAVVQVENGKYLGFGYIDTDQGFSNVEELAGHIHFYPDNRDVHSIIRQYLRKNKIERIIKY